MALTTTTSSIFGTSTSHKLSKVSDFIDSLPCDQNFLTPLAPPVHRTSESFVLHCQEVVLLLQSVDFSVQCLYQLQTLDFFLLERRNTIM